MNRRAVYLAWTIILLVAVVGFALSLAGGPRCSVFAVVERPVGSLALFPEFNKGGDM